MQWHVTHHLYLQANDIWPAPSWSALEYGGRPKVLFYESRRFFADLLVTGYVDRSAAELYLYVSNMVGSDQRQPLQGASVVVTAWSWAAGRMSNWTTPVPTIAAHASGRVCSVPLATVTRGCPSLAACVLTLDLYGPESVHRVTSPGMCRIPAPYWHLSWLRPPCNPTDGSSSNSSILLAHNWVFIAPFRNVTTMRDPGLLISNVSAILGDDSAAADNLFTVTVTAKVLPAASVWLETALPGRFSDNGFLLTQPSYTVEWVSKRPGVTAQQLAASLLLHSLWDVAPYDEGGPI